MKIDREHFENATWDGEKLYKFVKIAENIGAYVGTITEFWFELDTLERIGIIEEVDNRTNFKSYYTAKCVLGWDGKNKTKKQFIKTLCTRGEYNVAKNLLFMEYKARK